MGGNTAIPLICRLLTKFQANYRKFSRISSKKYFLYEEPRILVAGIIVIKILSHLQNEYTFPVLVPKRDPIKSSFMSLLKIILEESLSQKKLQFSRDEQTDSIGSENNPRKPMLLLQDLLKGKDHKHFIHIIIKSPNLMIPRLLEIFNNPAPVAAKFNEKERIVRYRIGQIFVQMGLMVLMQTNTQDLLRKSLINMWKKNEFDFYQRNITTDILTEIGNGSTLPILLDFVDREISSEKIAKAFKKVRSEAIPKLIDLIKYQEKIGRVREILQYMHPYSLRSLQQTLLDCKQDFDVRLAIPALLMNFSRESNVRFLIEIAFKEQNIHIQNACWQVLSHCDVNIINYILSAIARNLTVPEAARKILSSSKAHRHKSLYILKKMWRKCLRRQNIHEMLLIKKLLEDILPRNPGEKTTVEKIGQYLAKISSEQENEIAMKIWIKFLELRNKDGWQLMENILKSYMVWKRRDEVIQDRTKNFLSKVARHKDPVLRVHAIRLLPYILDASVISILQEAENDTDIRVRDAARRSLLVISQRNSW